MSSGAPRDAAVFSTTRAVVAVPLHRRRRPGHREARCTSTTPSWTAVLLQAGLGAAAVAVVGSELALPAAAHAAPGTDLDWIISCDEWAARPPADPLSVSAIPTNKIIVHHMAFPNVTDYSRSTPQLARDCQDLQWTATAGPTPGSTSR
ncbi:hypothetical protein V2I01_36770 [Micromonospora sp. BRA006-A]|nr:hypothetical protein [Micromonospora sp. BRA006-A]